MNDFIIATALILGAIYAVIAITVWLEDDDAFNAMIDRALEEE